MDTAKFLCVVYLSFTYALARKEINIAVLLPRDTFYLFSIPRVAPALQMAVEHIHSRTDLLNDVDIKIHYRDSKCDIAHSMNEAINFYLHKQVDVYFGPVCDYAAAPVARQVPFWDVPMITAGAMSGAFRHKQEYPLMTRVGANVDSLADVIFETLHRFGWKKVKLVYQPRAQGHIVPGFCHMAAQAIYHKIKRSHSDIQVEKMELRYGYMNPDELNSQIQNHSVFVMCASPNSGRDLIKHKAHMNSSSSDHVFLNIDLFSSTAQQERPWYRQHDRDEWNEVVLQAYESVITVTLRKPESAEYRRFASEVKRREKAEYPDDVYKEDDDVNHFVGSFHDGLILYALALNETMEAGLDARNGTEITSRNWNRTFTGITGTVSMDDNGDRYSDFSLLDLNPETKKFETVANYYGNKQELEFIPGKSIHWPVVLNQPLQDTL